MVRGDRVGTLPVGTGPLPLRGSGFRNSLFRFRPGFRMPGMVPPSRNFYATSRARATRRCEIHKIAQRQSLPDHAQVSRTPAGTVRTARNDCARVNLALFQGLPAGGNRAGSKTSGRTVIFPEVF